MIFLPNKFEKFCAALRNYTQIGILKNGMEKKYLKRLRKIHYAEAVFLSTEKPVEVALLSRILLSYCHIKRLRKNEVFHFLVLGNFKFILKERPYSALLLILSREVDFIKIVLKKSGISIFCNSLPKETFKLIKTLGGIYLYEKKTKTAGIFIPAVLTDKEILDNSYYQNLKDELCPVNLYLN